MTIMAQSPPASRGQARSMPAVPRSITAADRLSICAIWLLLIARIVGEILGQTEIVSFGFYTLHSLDPAIVVVLLATLAHLSAGRLDRRPYTVPILIMALLITINFLRGLALDPASALLWIRANGGIAVLLMLALTMRPTAQVMQATRNGLLVASFLLCALVLARLASHPTLFMTYAISDADANDGGRPLSADGTLMLVFASAVLTSEILRRRRFVLDALVLFVIALPVLILLTGQATTNIAEFFVLGALIFFQRGRSQHRRVLLGGIAVVALFGILATLLPQLMESHQLLHRSDNFGTRQEIWSSLMRLWPSLALSVQLFGFPAGQRPALLVYMNERYTHWSHSIHSMYLGALPVMGYVGAMAFIALLAILTWKSLVATSRKGAASSALPFACCIATAIFSVSNETLNDSLIGLFIAIWWLRATSANEEAKVMRLPRGLPKTAFKPRRSSAARSA